MKSCVYNNQKYYFVYETDYAVVMSQKKEKLSVKECREKGFETLEEFAFFLDKLTKSKQSTKHKNYDESSFSELVSENLVSSQGIPLSKAVSKTLLKGLNYGIIKQVDYEATANALLSISLKNKLNFVKLSFEYPNNFKPNELSIKRYLKSPFGQLTRTHLKVAPFLASYVLRTLQRLRN